MKQKLYQIAGKAGVNSQQSDNFWPLPATFIGIELEIEGIRNRVINGGRAGPNWNVVKDNSLREGEEWVFAQPLLGVSLRNAISWFFENVKGYKLSTRTSTHIHINMMDDDGDGDALRNTLGLYIAAEDFFFDMAGEDRKWSGYCAPMEEAPIDLLHEMVRVPMEPENLHRVLNMKRQNADRYYALNLLSLQKHGTLEFRHFPCTYNEADVVNWTKQVMYLKLGGIRMSKADVNVFEVMSRPEGVAETLKKYLPEMAEDILRFCPEHKIASKISAIHTYADAQQAQFRYDVDVPGIFQNWVKKKGMLDAPKGDQKELLLYEQQTEALKQVVLNATAEEKQAERHRKITMKEYININKRSRMEGRASLRIPRETRYLYGVDMLPKEERIAQDAEFPQHKAKPAEVPWEYRGVDQAMQDPINEIPNAPPPFQNKGKLIPEFNKLLGEGLAVKYVKNPEYNVAINSGIPGMKMEQLPYVNDEGRRHARAVRLPDGMAALPLRYNHNIV